MKHEHALTKRQLRHRRVSARVRGTGDRPRLYVYRTGRHLYAQILDDQAGKTLVTVAEQHLKDAKGTKTVRAQALGTLLAEKAKALKVKRVRFDRGPNQYHGRIQAFADAARTAGLEF